MLPQEAARCQETPLRLLLTVEQAGMPWDPVHWGTGPEFRKLGSGRAWGSGFPLICRRGA